MTRSKSVALVFGWIVCCGGPAWGAVAGRVVAAGSRAPIAGARVRLQAQDDPLALSDADGRFTLPVEFGGTAVITAGVAYDCAAAVNYTTNGVFARNGASDVLIELEPMPEEDNDAYVPIKAKPPNACGDCHSEHYLAWRGSAHARAAVNPWVLDVYSGNGTAGGSAGYVFRDTHDADDTGSCATCHTPVAEARAPGTLFLDEVTGTSELEGINCSACHTIDDVNHETQLLHLQGNATMRFPLAGVGGSATHEYVWGPLDDVSYAFMRPAYAPIFRESRFCASCHEYINVETGAPGQKTYSEWLASRFAVPGAEYRTCQDCHMPELGIGTIADPPPPFEGVEVIRPSNQRHAHDFPGSTAERLREAVEVELDVRAEDGRVLATTRVHNAGAGHAFPTGVSIRNVLLVLDTEVDGTAATQVAGPIVPDWANDDVEGLQEGDYGGRPGQGYAKISEGRINGQGETVSPVLFVDAERVLSDTTIPSGATSTAEYEWRLPEGTRAGATLRVSARLLYRRAFRALMVTKGWTTAADGGPIEIEVANLERAWELTASEVGEATCGGDCNGDGEVTVDEIVTGVSIALGTFELGVCPAFDGGGDGAVTVDELVRAIDTALRGCGAN